MRIWIEKFKEVVASVLPITVIVTLLNFTLVPLGWLTFTRFLIGAAFIIVGLSAFLVGVDTGITPLGSRLGGRAAHYPKLALVALAGLMLGIIVSVAEPDLHILATQVSLVTEGLIRRWSIVWVVSAGLGTLVAIGLVRILKQYPLHKLLTITYAVIFLLGLRTSPEFLAIAFDASGATTGAMTVPFILALAIGVSSRKRGGQPHPEDSFGLVALASAGAILAVLVMGQFVPATNIAAATVDLDPAASATVWGPFADQARHIAIEGLLAVLPLVALLTIGQALYFHLKAHALLRLYRGLFLSWLGLVLLLVGVNAGFMHVGREISASLAGQSSALLLLVGFGIGLVTVLAEPAVHVLTRQIFRVTHGTVPRGAVLAALSLGVGTAVGFSILRVLIAPLQLWHILLPGYLLALALAWRNTELFVGMAFDAGGVVSGPMTATFILAYAQGAANAVHSANVLIDGFGVIALVALAPLLTLQILGLAYGRRIAPASPAAGGNQPGGAQAGGIETESGANSTSDKKDT